MNKINYSLLNKPSVLTQGRRMALFLVLGFVALFCMPETASSAAGSMITFDEGSGGTAAVQFNKLRGGMQSFAVVVLLIMLVIAAIMAAMQKVTMAINVAIAAIILFGGGYIMLLIYEGLNG